MSSIRVDQREFDVMPVSAVMEQRVRPLARSKHIDVSVSSAVMLSGNGSLYESMYHTMSIAVLNS